MRFNYRGDLLVKRGCIKKSWLNIYIYIYIKRGVSYIHWESGDWALKPDKCGR